MSSDHLLMLYLASSLYLCYSTSISESTQAPWSMCLLCQLQVALYGVGTENLEKTWHNLPLITDCIGVDVRELTSGDWLCGVCRVLGGLYVDSWIALGRS